MDLSTSDEKENRRSCKTIVVFDIETTGLHHSDRITELALIAVHTEELSTWNYVSKGSRKTKCPRVVNKLSLCVNPERHISSRVEKLTGLSNWNLKKQMEFNTDLVTVIRLFLRRLDPPVCLVAHNGDRFDFPRLVREIMNCKEAELPQDVMTADSLSLFRELEGEPGNCNSPAGNSTCIPLKIPKSVLSYKLTEIYKRRTGSKPSAVHGAEADCYTLLELIKIGGRAALNWIDTNAVPLSVFKDGNRRKSKSKSH